jgi:hypothetical protein
VISNAVALPLDLACAALASGANATYTRYADDLTFSGDDQLPAIDALRSVVEAQGFVLAEDKTRRSKIGQAHYVTGLSISDPAQPHVPSERKRRLRQELYYAGKFGIADHFRHRGVNDARVIQQEVNRVDGLVRFVAHHEPAMAPRLRTQWRKALQDEGMKPSFAPRGQHRAPFFIFVDEADFDRGGQKVLAIGMAVSQHGPRMAIEAGQVLEAALADMYLDGDPAALRKRGVDTTIGYMSDCSSNPIFAEFAADCPNARAIHAECVHIPVHPNLRSKDLNHMIEAVRAAVMETSA